jgi:hypothetical protein
MNGESNRRIKKQRDGEDFPVGVGRGHLVFRLCHVVPSKWSCIGNLLGFSHF